jgi:hypothetical protein
MVLAIGLLNNWIAAKVKLRVLRVAARPAAGVWSERADLLSGG